MFYQINAAMNKIKLTIGFLIILLIVSIGTSFMLYQKAHQKSANPQLSGANTQ
jgi:hypothetical protein